MSKSLKRRAKRTLQRERSSVGAHGQTTQKRNRVVACQTKYVVEFYMKISTELGLNIIRVCEVC